jgi:glycerol-3-phosphate acyltransferase PlsY
MAIRLGKDTLMIEFHDFVDGVGRLIGLLIMIAVWIAILWGIIWLFITPCSKLSKEWHDAVGCRPVARSVGGTVIYNGADWLYRSVFEE